VSGNTLYIADLGNYRVRQVDLGSGRIVNLAGTGEIPNNSCKSAGDNGPATLANLCGPTSVAVIGDAVFIADTFNHKIRRVAAGVITTFAGSGNYGGEGDGGPAVAATLASPRVVAAGRDGSLYIADTENGRVRRVQGGTISAVPGASGFRVLAGLAFDRDGILLASDRDQHLVRRVLASGTSEIIAGSRDFGNGRSASAALVRTPRGLALDSATPPNLYVTDDGANQVRRFRPGAPINVFAGNGSEDVSGDGGRAVDAGLRYPRGLVFDSSGAAFLADTYNHKIRRIGVDGAIAAFAGTGDGSFAGDGGPALSARLYAPSDVAVSGGNLYIADEGNHRVRVVASGQISTFAGAGTSGFGGDNGPAAQALLSSPRGLAIDAEGSVYISDSGNHRIRRVSRAGVITTYAGTGVCGFSGDNGPAASAQICAPGRIAIQGGFVYFTDTEGNRVRRVDPSGTIVSIAGTGVRGYAGDRGPATASRLSAPFGIAVDALGTVYIADTGNERVRALAPALSASGSELSFQHDPASAAAPAPQTFQVSASREGTEFTLTPVSQGGWLRVSANRSTTPATATVSVSPAGLATGSYTGRISIAAAGHANSPLGVDVFLSVRSPLTVSALPDSLSFEYQSGDLNPLPKNVVVPTSDGTPCSFTATPSSPGNWLQINPASGTTPGPISVSVNPANLAAGTHQGFVTVAAPCARNSPISLPVTLVYTSRPSIRLASDQLTFIHSAGSAAPAPQDAFILSSGSRLTFTAAATVASPAGGRWLRVTPAGGATPARLSVSVDPSGLAAGTYAGAIAITSPDASQASQSLPVTFVIQPARPDRLTASPEGVAFSVTQSSGVQSRRLTLSNSSVNPAGFRATASTASGGDWLGVTPPAGTVAAAGTDIVTIAVSPAGLAAGTYSGTVTIADTATGGGVRTVPVTLNVGRTQQLMDLSVTALAFTAVVDGGNDPPQSFAVLNLGQGSMNWTASANLLSEGNWLSVTPTSGRTDAGVLPAPRVAVSVNKSGLAPGTYHGRIRVSSEGADNSPQFTTVVLNVLPRGSNPGPRVQPAGLVFTSTVGLTQQTTTVTNLTGSPLRYRSSRLTDDGADWIDATPAEATVEAGQSMAIAIRPRLEVLPAGTRRGVVTLLFSDGNVRNISLLAVQPASAPAAGRGAAGCTPTRLLPLITSLYAGIGGGTGYLPALEVRSVDDCGDPTSSGEMTATLSPEQLVLGLKLVGSGRWERDWQPGAASSKVAVKAAAEGLAGEVELNLGPSAPATSPVLSSGGVLSGASFARNRPTAPGAFISIFGLQLADRLITRDGPPYPLELGDTSVSMGDVRLPLQAVSPTQINAIVPYGIRTGVSQPVIVQRGRTQTAPDSVLVAAAQPAVFTVNQKGDGQGAITDAGYRLVNAGNPTKAGDTVIIFCTGLGEVDPAVASGAAAAGLARTRNPVTVSIGGRDARVDYAGLTPGFAGLYQVNAVVPDGVAPSDAVEVVLRVAGQLSSPVTMAIR
jgi:uncharacterized protein (TIGR03437 family)